MIIKGQARGRARQLAAHLLRADENERIRLLESRGTLAKDIEGALIEMEARAVAARTRRSLYHASISPEPGTPLSDQEIGRAADHLEERLGLHGQPRIVVLHRKKQREHVHIVWSRVDAESGAAIPYSWNYRVHEQTSRELEAMFGHRAVAGTRSTRQSRPIAEYEFRQAERSGRSAAQVTDEITQLWQASPSSEAFRRKLEEAGYQLARGDRRVFVVVDRAGEIHSLARRIRGLDTATLRTHMKSLDLRQLPSVAEAKQAMTHSRNTGGLASGFRAAATEVTRNDKAFRERRIEASPTVVLARRAFEQATRPHTSTGTVKPLRMVCRFPSHYRASRAIILADYASKIAAARSHTPPETLEAVLEALKAERSAALARLTREVSGGERVTRQGKPRSRSRHAHLRVLRFRLQSRLDRKD
jgi:Relaxase/Mobilisation nuclease domain